MGEHSLTLRGRTRRTWRREDNGAPEVEEGLFF